MTRPRLDTVLVAVVAVVLLPLLYARMNAVDPVEHEPFAANVRRLEHLEARLNQDVLEAEAGLTESYDPIANDLTEIDQISAELDRLPSFLQADDLASLGSEIAVYRSGAAVRKAWVEQFESHNAVLRNSTRYFPIVANELADGAPGSARIEHPMHALEDGVLLYLSLPSADLERSVRERIASAREHASRFPADRLDTLETVLWHAETILDKKSLTDRTVRRIVTSPTSVTAHELVEHYETAYEQARYVASVSAREWYLSLLLLVGFFGWRLVMKFKASNRALSAAKERAESADHVKSEFLACMSHEIRTPLNGIVATVDMLLDSDLDPRQLDYAKTAKTSTDALLDVLNDVLDFSKIEAGGMTIDPYECNLRELVDTAARLLASRAGEKGLEMVVRFDPDTPRRVVVDGGRVRQILLNLIGNAIKFTAEGFVRVTAECVEYADTRAIIRLSVEDSGIGISADKIGHVFERFTQADASTTRRFGGTGLGLAISKRLAELLGGSLRATSVAGEGSTFVLELPVRVISLESGEYRPIDPANSLLVAPASGERILFSADALLVDDNEVNRKVGRLRLEALGVNVTTASRAAEALEALERRPFDIVFMDCQMPDMDGYEATAVIRRREAGTDRHTPIVAMTAHALEGTRERCLAAGMDDYLSKPISAHSLSAILDRWAARRDSGTTPDELRGQIRTALAGIVNGFGPEMRESLQRELVAAFSLDVATYLESMRVAAAAGDAERLGRAAHGMKGGSRDIGALHLSRLCMTIEEQSLRHDLDGTDRLVAQVGDEIDRVQSILAEVETHPI